MTTDLPAPGERIRIGRVVTSGRQLADDEPWRMAMVATAVCSRQRADALDRSIVNAPFLARQAEAHADTVARWLADGLSSMLDAIIEPPCDDGDAAAFMRALRAWRHRGALLIALGDLSGELDLDGVTATLSIMADAAVDAALGRAVRERHPDAPWHGGIAVIALG